MCFPYPSDLGLAPKGTCLTFGRYLWWSSHSFYVWGFGAGLQGLWLLTCVTADLIAHFIVDSHVLHFQPNLPLIFSLSWAKCVCKHDAKWHLLLLRSSTTVKRREVRHRQVLVCLCGLHYLHGSSMSLWVTVHPCFSLYPMFFYKYYSNQLTLNSISTPDSYITAFYTLFYQTNIFLNANLYN